MGIVHHSRHDIDWLADGPLGPFVDAFKQHLIDRRYAAQTFASYLRAIAHFAQWMRGRRLRLQRVGEASIAEFLDAHLPDCCCAGPVHRDRGDVSAALGHLLVVLRSLGVIEPPPARAMPVDEELRRYDGTCNMCAVWRRRLGTWRCASWDGC